MRKQNHVIKTQNPIIETIKNIAFMLLMVGFFLVMWMATPGCATGKSQEQRRQDNYERMLAAEIDPSRVIYAAKAQTKPSPLFVSTGRTATIEIQRVNGKTGTVTVERRSTIRLPGAGEKGQK